MEELQKDITKTLLYYDIFSHPLSGDEIFSFLPHNTVTKSEVKAILAKTVSSGKAHFSEKDGYYFIKPSIENVNRRKEKEFCSKKMWKRAEYVTHIIKRFPYVRAVMVTGSLSKNSSDKNSDIDFMLITKPGRLWITRTLLMLFKKLFLFNSYKFFCINYIITEDKLEISDKNVFTATEIATIKAAYNSALMNKFIKNNSWVTEYFPNYKLCDPMMHTSGCKVNEKVSILQAIAEFIIPVKLATLLDKKLMYFTRNHWKKRYPHLNDEERNLMFRSTENVSKTHPGNMQKKILELYSERLKQYNLISCAVLIFMFI